MGAAGLDPTGRVRPGRAGRERLRRAGWERLRRAGWLRVGWAGVRRAGDRVRHSDLAIAYGTALLLVFAFVHWRSHPASHAIVVHSSTNLVNLRAHPFQVLVVSAFVLADPDELALLPVLMIVFALVQAWLGRLVTLVTAVIGHVGATLFVAMVLITGIAHGRIRPSVSDVPDVGVSYEVACLSGLLIALVPPRRRGPYVALLVALLAVPFPLSPSFTNLGHATALVLGLGLGLIAIRAGEATAAGPGTRRSAAAAEAAAVAPAAGRAGVPVARDHPDEAESPAAGGAAARRE